jgi:phage I-like protein
MTTMITTAIPTVDRAAPGQAPTAFMIWREGEVETTKGTFYVTADGIGSMVDKCQKQGVKIPFDADHLSLDSSAPLANRAAVGWHEIEMRNGPDGAELWAVRCEWSPEVKSGLEARPPRWQYFSPVFTVEDGAIVAYLNCALTNLPATRGAQSIAAGRIAASKTNACHTSKGSTMQNLVHAQLVHLADNPAEDTIVRANANAELVRRGLRDPRLASVVRPAAVEHVGTRMVCNLMTPEAARVELARRGVALRDEGTFLPMTAASARAEIDRRNGGKGAA